MAFRRTSRSQRRLTAADRIDRLNGAIPVSEGPRMGDLIARRCKNQREANLVIAWLAKLVDPEADVSVCCDFDAARRFWEWEKADGNVDLDDLEEQHRCHP